MELSCIAIFFVFLSDNAMPAFYPLSHSLSFLVISVTLCLDMLGWHGRNNIFYKSFVFVYSSKFQVYRIIVRL